MPAWPTDLPAVLAARGTVVIVSTPLGIALGGPLVSLLGGGGTLVASGLATVLLAASRCWSGRANLRPAGASPSIVS